MRRITVEQRRHRLARRHHLARTAAAVETVATDLIGLHATDPVSIYLGARARTTDLTPQVLEAALYERRSLVRVLGMRRTLFVVPAALFATVDVAAARALAGPERRRVAKWLEEAGATGDGVAWLRALEDQAEAALAARGPSAAAELAAEVPELQQQILVNEGRKYEGKIGLSSRVLLLLAMEGRVVRGQPRGSWLSTQYRWVATRAWLGDLRPLPSVDEASADLARRYLHAFGPATFDDLRWYMGWAVAKTRKALEAVGPVEVDLDGATGLVLADDLEPEAAPAPWVALLPALDTTVMAWKERDWYLGEHRAALFDRNGNAGPTVWVDGRVAGGWVHRSDGEVVVRLLEDVGADARAAIDAEAAALSDWLGDTRFTPRFRTPLERELSA